MILSDSGQKPEIPVMEFPLSEGIDESDREHISWEIAVADDFAKAHSMSLSAVAELFKRFCIFDYLDSNAEVLMGRTGDYLVNKISSRVGLPKSDR